MNQALALFYTLVVAAFAGGCLCISVTLSGLGSGSALKGARIMQTLLPRMGAVMAPLLAAALLSGSYLYALGLRGSGDARSGLPVLACFAAIALVTVSVHVPANAQLLGPLPLTAAQADRLLRRWLLWHHLRTALALAALAALLWPLRASLLRRALRVT